MIINTNRRKRKRKRYKRDLTCGRMPEALDRARELRGSMTKAEYNTAKALNDNKIRYYPQFVIFYGRGKYRIVDFYLPDYQINLEVDGPSHETSKEYDQYKDKRTKHRIVRILNETTYKPDFAITLLSLLGKPKPIIHKLQAPKPPIYTPRPKPSLPIISTCKGYTLDELKKLGIL